MTNPTDTRALQALADKVEAGRRMLLSDMLCLGHGRGQIHTAQNALSAYYGSLDAAKALHEAVADDWTYIEMRSRLRRKLWAVDLERLDRNGESVYATGRSSVPARAWLLAIIRALIAGGRDGQA